MTLAEIKEIAETWFDWPEEKREQVIYTSAMLFAREMYERGQRVERDKTEELIAAADAVAMTQAIYGGIPTNMIDRMSELLERMKEEAND